MTRLLRDAYTNEGEKFYCEYIGDIFHLLTKKTSHTIAFLHIRLRIGSLALEREKLM